MRGTLWLRSACSAALVLGLLACDAGAGIELVGAQELAIDETGVLQAQPEIMLCPAGQAGEVEVLGQAYKIIVESDCDGLDVGGELHGQATLVTSKTGEVTLDILTWPSLSGFVDCSPGAAGTVEMSGEMEIIVRDEATTCSVLGSADQDAEGVSGRMSETLTNVTSGEACVATSQFWITFD